MPRPPRHSTVKNPEIRTPLPKPNPPLPFGKSGPYAYHLRNTGNPCGLYRLWGLEVLDPDAELDRARSLPPECYTHPEWRELDLRRVFGASWLPVCRTELVDLPGSYLALNLAGEPIVVARNLKGQLHAFSNICRHRAARVVPEGCGEATRFTCPYHGWMYDLAGNLTGIPEGVGMTTFRREKNPLPAWHLEVWDRWVWVHAPHPAPQSLDSQIGPFQLWLGDRLEGYRWIARREYPVACDWKVFVDNYLDGGYHVGPVHPGLAAGLVGKEYTTRVHDKSSLQSCPLSGSANGGMAWYWHLWPAWMINLYGDVADTNLVLPDGAGRCRVVFDWYALGECPPDRVEAIVASSDQVQREDMQICEEVQSNLSSRFYQGGPYVPKRELAGWRFHQMWAETTGFKGFGGKNG